MGSTLDLGKLLRPESFRERFPKLTMLALGADS